MTVVKKFDATGRDLASPDPDLSRIVNEYPLFGLIAPSLCPPVRAGMQSGYFPVLGNPPRVEAMFRSPGIEPREISVDVSTVSFYTQGFGLWASAPLEDFQAADVARRYEESLSRTLTNYMRAAWEVRVSSLFAQATTVSTTFSCKSAWSGTGRAFQTVENAINFIEDGSGFRPTVVGFGKTAWRGFSSNSSTLSALNGEVTLARAAERLRVSEVVVSEAVLDSAGEGFPYSPTPIWDDVIVITGQPANPGEVFGRRHSATAYWLPPGGGGSVPGQYVVDRLGIDSKRKSKGIMVSEWSGLVVLDPSLAICIRGVNSSQAGGV
jgi:hypothetical protein